mmetsp:Transcript_8308/g.22857  ORF Transcript_8308/g.22857 Transcript_8308/m.22857 type:complete len:217 (-) Transcript_8308:253-903(-)
MAHGAPSGKKKGRRATPSGCAGVPRSRVPRPDRVLWAHGRIRHALHQHALVQRQPLEVCVAVGEADGDEPRQPRLSSLGLLPHVHHQHGLPRLRDVHLVLADEAVLAAEDEGEESSLRELAHVDDPQHLIEKRSRDQQRSPKRGRAPMLLRSDDELDHEGLKADEGEEYPRQQEEAQAGDSLQAASLVGLPCAPSEGRDENLWGDKVQRPHGAERA